MLSRAGTKKVYRRQSSHPGLAECPLYLCLRDERCLHLLGMAYFSHSACRALALLSFSEASICLGGKAQAEGQAEGKLWRRTPAYPLAASAADPHLRSPSGVMHK